MNDGAPPGRLMLPEGGEIPALEKIEKPLDKQARRWYIN